MLTLTRKTEYALIAVCHLTRVGQKVVSARDIAEEHSVPLPLLMNVLKRLNRTGHVNSVRGAR
ncbi:MAG: Rrf2 family transcriptional regulator, partial [Planctomycetota bacterium]